MNNYFDSKRGWQRINYHRDYQALVKMFEETIEEAKRIGIFPKNVISISYYIHNQLRAVANCYWHQYGYGGEVHLALCFNTGVAKQFDPETLRETVIHEVAHACTIGDHHGYRWQMACRRIGAKWGMLYHYFSRLETNPAVNAVLKEQKLARTKYTVSCPACGRTWRYTKAGKVVQRAARCTCPCGWKGLEVQQLN